MKVTILVLVLAAALVAILALAGMAFYRGRFRLAPTPSETKGRFLLMLKKDKIGEGDQEALKILKNKGREAEDNVAPPSPKN
jgi:hypothetical protein